VSPTSVVVLLQTLVLGCSAAQLSACQYCRELLPPLPEMPFEFAVPLMLAGLQRQRCAVLTSSLLDGTVAATPLNRMGACSTAHADSNLMRGMHLLFAMQMWATQL
jgi:hypothetical protein